MGRLALVMVAAALALLLPNVPPPVLGADPGTGTGYAPHGPIVINGDGDFTAANGVTRGSGTDADRYIIEGWDIGGAAGDGVRVLNTAAYFTLRSLYIHAAGDHGVYLYNVSNGRISNVLLSANQKGISVSYSTNVTIRRVTVLDSRQGWGIHVHASHVVSVTGSRALANAVGGILLAYSTGANVTGVSLAGGRYGLDTYESMDVAISATTISNATRVGLLVETSSGVVAYHDNFVHNAIQASLTLGAAAIFDHGYPDGGNFWSDYRGVDHCSGKTQLVCNGPDGLGDFPYDNGSVHDRYPLMEPYDTPPRASFAVAPTTANASTLFSVDASASTDLEDPPRALEVRWDWEGDGVWDTNWSLEKVAHHRYDEPGTYHLGLEVRDSGGATNATRMIVVVTPAPLVASASIDATQGTAPLTISFTGQARGGVRPYTYGWDFGDGSTGAGPAATHTYGGGGAFKILLLVTDAQGIRGTAVVFVQASKTLTVAVGADVTSGTVPLTLSLRALPTGGRPPYTYLWEFGDGGSSTLENPYHTYEAAGTYTVTLRVQEGGGTNSTDLLRITALPPRGQAFTAPPATAPAAMVVLGAALVAVLVLQRRRR